MVNSRIKLMAVDLDGTLLDLSGKIDKEAKGIFEKLTRKNILIAIITSRSLEDVLPVFIENGIKDDNFASLIISDEREIYISKDGNYLPLSQEWNDWIIREEEKLLPLTKEFLKKWSKKFHEQGFQFSGVSTEVERRRKYTSLVFSELNQAEQARQYIEKEIFFLNLALRAVRPARCLDLRSNKTGKGKALKKAVEILGISASQVFCIGDSHNDLEMLDGRYKFKSACPANAEDMIKEVVLKNNGYVARYNYGKGVAEIIENRLSNKCAANKIVGLTGESPVVVSCPFRPRRYIRHIGG